MTETQLSQHIPKLLLQNKFQYYPSINGYDFQKVSSLQDCNPNFKRYMAPTIELKAGNAGSSKKMDGISNRYNLKSTRRNYTFGVLKCSEKFSFRLTLVHFNMCTICSSGDVQTKFYLLPPFLNHVSCYSFNGWCDPFLQVLEFLIFSAYTMFLMYPHRKKSSGERSGLWGGQGIGPPLPIRCLN